MNKSITTQVIKDSLGASYTISEVEDVLFQSKAKSAAQAPYFDGRLLDRIAKIENILRESGVEV